MTLRLDHLVVAAASLEEGVAWVEERLGVPPAGRGRHARMGTHNALWSLGPFYLEVIAVDPEGDRPDRPRWFGFDDPDVQAMLAKGPRLLSWAVATEDADTLAELGQRAPSPHDPPVDYARDDLHWKVALQREAPLPAGGGWPLAICWTEGHPTKRLPDQGLALERLTVYGPGAAMAERALGRVEGPVLFVPSDWETRLEAEVATPSGVALL